MMKQEAKLIPTTRATLGYMYYGVSTTSGGKGLYPTCVNLWLRVILMVGDIQGLQWSFIWCQKLRLSGEIPIVVLNSLETDCGMYVLLVC